MSSNLKYSNPNNIEILFNIILLSLSITLSIRSIWKWFVLYIRIKKDEFPEANNILKKQDRILLSIIGIFFPMMIFRFFNTLMVPVDQLIFFEDDTWSFVFNLAGILTLGSVVTSALVMEKILKKCKSKVADFDWDIPFLSSTTTSFYLLSLLMFHMLRVDSVVITDFVYTLVCPFAILSHICYYILNLIIFKKLLRRCEAVVAESYVPCFKNYEELQYYTDPAKIVNFSPPFVSKYK